MFLEKLKKEAAEEQHQSQYRDESWLRQSSNGSSSQKLIKKKADENVSEKIVFLNEEGCWEDTTANNRYNYMELNVNL
jgi:hypothetical protein